MEHQCALENAAAAGRAAKGVAECEAMAGAREVEAVAREAGAATPRTRARGDVCASSGVKEVDAAEEEDAVEVTESVKVEELVDSKEMEQREEMDADVEMDGDVCPVFYEEAGDERRLGGRDVLNHSYDSLELSFFMLSGLVPAAHLFGSFSLCGANNFWLEWLLMSTFTSPCLSNCRVGNQSLAV